MKSISKHYTIRRRNFFPTLIIAVILWLALAGLVYFTGPDAFGVIPLFFILIFLSLLFTFSLVFANTRRGILASVGIILLLILRYFGIGNILNFLIIAGLAITIEVYFIRTN